MNKENTLISLTEAVEAIKTAILQGQYEALKDVNRVQLAVYFAIGKYLSKNTRKMEYGSGALKAISEQLRKEMPGLRGYSETSLKKMRLFYEHWRMLDSNACVTTHASDSEESCVITHDSNKELSISNINDISSENTIDVFRTITIPNIVNFPIEDFFNVPFSHHVEIYRNIDDINARYYYIHRTAEEHLSVDALEKIIKQQAPEDLRKALPDIEDLKKIISDEAVPARQETPAAENARNTNGK